MKRWLWLAVLTAAMTAAGAQEPAAQPPAAQQSASHEDGLQTILTQQQQLQRDLDAGKTNGMTARQVNLIHKSQREVFAVTQGKTRLDQLSMDEKVQLENALERINAEVKGTRAGQDNKQVCWREKQTGTTVNVTRCGTEAEMREAREGARDFLERPKVCGDRCG
ncbi:hypothetical protein AB4Y64_07500 [Lysobacter sp. TAF61]|uniref:hypothetical protein n=1 Tax=Lysobacter sp. TAF61 TaxID=3233072 RepID=UPI003F982095